MSKLNTNSHWAHSGPIQSCLAKQCMKYLFNCDQKEMAQLFYEPPPHKFFTLNPNSHGAILDLLDHIEPKQPLDKYKGATIQF